LNRAARRLVAFAVPVAVVAALLGSTRASAPPPLFSSGLLGNATALAAIPPEAGEAQGAAYAPGSTVLRLADGRLRYLPAGASDPVTVPAGDPGANARIAADRAWLALGTVPGANAAERDAASRSLLFLRLLQRPGGGVIAAATPYWADVWPRDASFAAAAFSVTGHRTEAAAILAFLARTQRPDGTWPARSHPDGTPVDDGRAPELDADGWVPWAAWLASGQGHDHVLAAWSWPMVRAAAEAAASALRAGGLPAASPDYWERNERQPTLGTAAALLTGLRAAADLAAALGHGQEGARWAAAAVRLAAATRRSFAGPAGYHRYPAPSSASSRVFGDDAGAAGGPDAAVTWLAPPFAPPDPRVRAAVARAAAQLAPGGGGAVPGLAWSDPWTPATASFALAETALGDRAAAARQLGWLLGHRTSLGAFPERVRRADGTPRSVAPLAWTHALVLLTLAEAEQPLPIP